MSVCAGEEGLPPPGLAPAWGICPSVPLVGSPFALISFGLSPRLPLPNAPTKLPP